MKPGSLGWWLVAAVGPGPIVTEVVSAPFDHPDRLPVYGFPVGRTWWAGSSLEWFVSGLPFYTPPAELAAAAVSAIIELTGREPELSTGGGTSDGRFIAPLGAQVAEVGVVNDTIHKVNECCRVEDIELLHRTLLGMLRRLLPVEK